VAEGVRLANELPGDLLLLEGSGSSIPPVHADVTGLVVPASIPLEYLTGYMGPFRVLLSDFVVVTMCENPFGSPSQISEISSCLRRAFRKSRRDEADGEIRVVRTVFRPKPVRSVEGTRAFVATTAPEAAGDAIRKHLEERYGCQVIQMSHSLSDRAKLQEEMEGIEKKADVLLCEIKAAGIEVATRRALDRDLEVVYMDNVPEGVGGDDPADTIRWAHQLAVTRYAEGNNPRQYGEAPNIAEGNNPRQYGEAPNIAEGNR
jgi:cyclic 2,3-diphosphoglycerate synthetase